MRMLTWAEYHEGTIGLLREYSIDFLNYSFFTSQGIIDNKKAAERLMNDENLSIKQKYKIACLYCFTDHIPALYRNMTKEDKEKEFYDAYDSSRIKQPGLVKFWSYYLMGDIDKLKGDKRLDQYRLEKAIESGSEAAVEYCLERTNLSRKKDVMVGAAEETIRCMIMIVKSDWVVFKNQKINDSKFLWVPNDYYVDVLYFLLSKMREDQKKEFLKKDIKGATYKREYFEGRKRCIVLEYFLDWPHQNFFMEMARLVLESLPDDDYALPESDYAVLLLKICDRIEFKDGTLKYGEEKSYNYRDLLMEFWNQSPEHYKRYVFSNEDVSYRSDRGVVRIKSGIRLLIILLSLKNFTLDDSKNINLILASATDKEKENILTSKEWRNTCIEQMKEQKWKILDWFVLHCFPSKEEADVFKRELSFTKEAQSVCIDFVEAGKWDAAESFIKWSSLPEEEIYQLKEEMIYFEDGLDACVNLISYHKKINSADKFIRWCFASEEKVKIFKKDLVFSYEGVWKCTDLVMKGQLELVDEFINFCLSCEAEIRKLKKSVAYRTGSSICKRLMSKYSEADIYDSQIYYTIWRSTEFKGNKWEEVEKFFTWCFSSEKEMSDFKKNGLLRMAGEEIHFNLIKSNLWEEADTFFAWLGLSDEEVKALKKETLFHYEAAGEMFSELMYSEEGDERFVDYGSKEEAIQLLLRWYLTDKESVLEFKDEFKRWYSGQVTQERKAMFEKFDFMIEQRLIDLDEEQNGVKRKCETYSSNKRFCNLKHENKGAAYGK